MKTMALEKPTNSKGYARLLLKHIFSKVRDTGSLMPPMEYKALAVQIGFNDSQLAIALRELKRENWIALDNTTQGIRLTPDGVHTGDYWQYRAESVLLNDPLPDSLESVRIEMNHFGQELQGTQPRSSEWQWISARIEALRHQENVMTKKQEHQPTSRAVAKSVSTNGTISFWCLSLIVAKIRPSQRL
jgi:hypothetical protein